jgi:tetratricopeptide (TPR) repeat protein
MNVPSPSPLHRAAPIFALTLLLSATGCQTIKNVPGGFVQHNAVVKIPFEGDFAEVSVRVHNFPANLHANNGIAALQTQQWDRAVDELKLAVAEKPNKASFRFALGVAHEARGEYAEAKEQYLKANERSGDEGLFDAQAGLKRIEARGQ